MAQDAHALDGNQETNSCSPVAGVRKPDEEGNLNADGDEEDGDGPFFPTLVYTLPSFEQEPATPEQVYAASYQ